MRMKYSEIFYSLQGEGANVGVPSIFLRLFGCNFECKGFGQVKDSFLLDGEMPHETFDLGNINNIDELPVFNKGCDSSASWSARYKHLAQDEDVNSVAKKIHKLLPNGSWNESAVGNNIHLIFTGGEPLLRGWQKPILELLNNEIIKPDSITFETNGTQLLLDSFVDGISKWQNENGSPQIFWSISPKLSNSGESFEDAIKPEVLNQMSSIPNYWLYLKFVVRNEENIQEAKDVIEHYFYNGVNIIDEVYLMPEGATVEELKISEPKVAKLALKHGFKYSPRLHCNLFGNKWGT